MTAGLFTLAGCDDSELEKAKQEALRAKAEASRLQLRLQRAELKSRELEIEKNNLREMRDKFNDRANQLAKEKERVTALATQAQQTATTLAAKADTEADSMASLKERVAQLPPQTLHVTELLLKHLDFVGRQIEDLEKRLQKLVRVTPEMKWLMTLPGFGFILSAVADLEIGQVSRFPDAEKLASYGGTTPRVHASGDKVRYGPLRSDVNHFLQWAFVEAANSIAVNAERCPDRHVSRLYRQVRQRKGHGTAIGAVARHLAEAAWHVLSRRQPYRDPALKNGLLREVQAR